jgi:membrane protease YdiL (CAAX protease family)
LSYLFSPQVFTRSYWRFPSSAWKWVGALVALQALTIALPPGKEPPIYKWEAVIDIVFSPPLEEVMRAVMVPPLIERWGLFLAIASTSIVTGILHSAPISSIVAEAALSIVFVRTNRSIPANVLAHVLINVLTVAIGGIRH